MKHLIAVAVFVTLLSVPTSMAQNAAPAEAPALKPCLIVAAGEHRINGAYGAVGLVMMASSKEYFAFRDQIGLNPGDIKLKYKQKELENIMRSGVKVVVADRKSNDTFNAMQICGEWSNPTLATTPATPVVVAAHQ